MSIESVVGCQVVLYKGSPFLTVESENIPPHFLSPRVPSITISSPVNVGKGAILVAISRYLFSCCYRNTFSCDTRTAGWILKQSISSSFIAIFPIRLVTSKTAKPFCSQLTLMHVIENMRPYRLTCWSIFMTHLNMTALQISLKSRMLDKL